jgi:hypothetical protein
VRHNFYIIFVIANDIEGRSQTMAVQALSFITLNLPRWKRRNRTHGSLLHGCMQSKDYFLCLCMRVLIFLHRCYLCVFDSMDNTIKKFLILKLAADIACYDHFSSKQRIGRKWILSMSRRRKLFNNLGDLFCVSYGSPVQFVSKVSLLRINFSQKLRQHCTSLRSTKNL